MYLHHQARFRLRRASLFLPTTFEPVPRASLWDDDADSLAHPFVLFHSQEYVDPAHAAEAVAKYNEGHFLGSQIKVELSLARQPLAKDGPLSSSLSFSPHQTRRLLTLCDEAELKALANRNGAQPNAPGSDRPSDPRKPMWINGSVFFSSSYLLHAAAEPAADASLLPCSSGPGGAPLGRGQRGGSGGPPPDFARDRYGPGPPAPGYGPPVGYGAPRYDERSPYDRPPMPGYGPPREYDRYGPPPVPHPGYGPPPMDRPPYDPYYDRAPAYPPPYPPVPVPGYPPAGPYERTPYPPAPLPPAAGAPRDPYAERYPPGPPPPGSGRSPVVPSRGSVPPAEPARAPYPPLDPYARPPPDMPPSGAYDPRDERGAGARYQPYPPREDRGYGGRSPSRYVLSLSLAVTSPLERHELTRPLPPARSGAPPLERRRSMSPRRNGSGDPYARDGRERDPYARDLYGPPPSAAGGYAPYDARGPPPMPPSGYGPPPGGRSPPRHPPVDEYVPRR